MSVSASWVIVLSVICVTFSWALAQFLRLEQARARAELSLEMLNDCERVADRVEVLRAKVKDPSQTAVSSEFLSQCCARAGMESGVPRMISRPEHSRFNGQDAFLAQTISLDSVEAQRVDRLLDVLDSEGYRFSVMRVALTASDSAIAAKKSTQSLDLWDVAIELLLTEDESVD